MTTVSGGVTAGSAHPPDFPGATGLFGHLKPFFKDTIGLVGRAPHDYPERATLRFAWQRVWLINNADDARYILQTNARNYRRPDNFQSILRDVTANSLFASQGDPWLRQRRALQPAFHRQRIAGFGTIMTEEAQASTSRLLAAARSGATVLVQNEMTRVALNIVGRALFGVDMEASARGPALANAFEGIAEYMNYRFRTPFAPPLWVPSATNRAFVRQRQTMRTIVADVLEERRRSGESYNDFLQMLMELRYDDTGEGMSDEQIVNESASFFFAGHETTANTLTWAWYLLAQNPDAETALHEELDQVLAGRTATVDDLPRLQYTQHVIEEALRLYPPAWVISRQAIAEDEIGGMHVKPGTGMMINTFGIQRHPAYWHDPDEFLPERFAAETPQHPRHAWIPFGEGPRLCIGNQFAMVETQLVLATLAQQIRLRTPAGYTPEPWPLFALRVRDSLPMQVGRRLVPT